MILTEQNYFSPEANQKYMSVSQFKDFAGSQGKQPCEALALAKQSGEWTEEKSTPLLVGSYVDSHFEGTLDIFKAQNPEIFTQKGELKANYKQAEYIIQRIERDTYFMMFMSGKKQVIMTANIFGVDWKIKIDSYLEDKAIVDLKVMASLTKSEWVKDYGHMSFINYWGYDIQGAIYQKVVEINTGKKLPFFIAGASKEKEPNIEIIFLDQQSLDDALSIVEYNLPRVLKVKNKEVKADRCGVCDYCRFTKVLSKPLHYSELIEKL